MLCICFFGAFAPLFFTSNPAVFVGGGAKIFFAPGRKVYPSYATDYAMSVLICFFRAFAHIFHFKLWSFCWWGSKNIFAPVRRIPLLVATPLITLWVPLLCHNGFAPASVDWTYRREGGKSINHGTGLTEIVRQKRRSILFSMLMFMPVVLTILTRNERQFGWFRNSVSLTTLVVL